MFCAPDTQAWRTSLAISALATGQSLSLMKALLPLLSQPEPRAPLPPTPPSLQQEALSWGFHNQNLPVRW